MLLLFVAGFVVLVSGFAGVLGVTVLVGFGLGVIGFILMNLVGIGKVPVLSSTIIVVLVVQNHFHQYWNLLLLTVQLQRSYCSSHNCPL